MALVPCQVLRVAILLSYCSILCNYKAIEMPSHQTYGGSWKFLTFIDLVRRPPPFPRRPAREPVCVRGEHPRAARSHSALASPPAVASRGLAASHPALPGRWGTGGGRAQPAEVGYFEGNTALLLRGDTERFSTKQMDWTTLIMNGLRPLRPQGAFQSTHRGIKLQQQKENGFLELLGASSERTKISS